MGGILLAAVVSSVQAASWPLEIIEHLDETKIVIYVNEDDIEQSPVWDPAAGAPPFKLAELLETLEKWEKGSRRITHPRIEKIELKPVLHHEKEGRWYYLIQLGGVQDGRPEHRYLAVLMNGKTAAAIEEPASCK